MTETASSAGDPLQRLLERCVVRVTVEGEHAGTGFFVAPGQVLTCAHVVARDPDRVAVLWKQVPGLLPAKVVALLPSEGAGRPHPYPDLALLRVGCEDHPCVRLDETEPSLGPPADTLRALGFTEVLDRGRPGLTPVTCTYEGLYQDADGPRLQVKSGQVMRGMSGAPLLSERSWRVVGMITTTRDGTDDLGGWATPAAQCMARLPGLRKVHDAFHGRDARWRQASLASCLGEALRPAHEPVPRHGSPARWLRPEHAVIRLRGREEELGEAGAWCLSPEGPVLRLLTAPGGTGKTRFAVELCRRLERRGWVCRFVSERAPATVMEVVVAVGGPILLVVDYAETRAGRATAGATLPELLEPLARLPRAAAPVRVLLLARSKGDWWNQLPSSSPEVQEVVGTAQVRRLGPVEERAEDRRAAYREAVETFAREQKMKLRREVRRKLSGPGFETILHLHMAALDDVGTPEDPGPTTLPFDRYSPAVPPGRGSVAVHLLARERRYWRRSAEASELEHRAWVLERAVAMASLLGGDDEGEAAAVLARVPDLQDAPEERRRGLARWLHDLYPGSRWLNPLQPGELAEELVGQVLEGCPELREHGFRGLRPDSAERALTLLDRAAQRRPELEPLLAEVLGSDPERLAPVAVQVAIQTGDPIGRLLAQVLKARPEALSRLVGLVEEIPHHTVALRELAVVLTERQVEEARQGDRIPDLARFLNNL